jgi:hypothetical protein
VAKRIFESKPESRRNVRGFRLNSLERCRECTRKNLSDNIPAIATKRFFIGVVIITASLHVSASRGHHQVNTIYYLVY